MSKALRVPVDGLKVGELILDQDGSHYVLRVHRVRPGQPLELFDPLRGIEATAILLDAVDRSAVCRIDAIRAASAVPKGELTLLFALAKGDKVDQVVRDATALGVTRILLFAASRSVVRLDAEDAAARSKRWQRIAVEAARQCGRGNLPEIALAPELAAAIDRVSSDVIRLLLSPFASAGLADVLAGELERAIAVLIGPEGGFTAEEEQHALSQGFRAARFNEYVLRTETAATAVLGALASRRGAAGV